MERNSLNMDLNLVSELEKINKNETENVESNDNKCPSPFRRQAIIAFGIFLMGLGSGATVGMPAILIPQLMETRDDMSPEITSWIAATACLGLFFGNLLSGYLMESYGRRLSILSLAIVFTSGWLMIGLATDVLYLIFVGRFITGLCQGWLGPLGPVFVGEISSPAYRGLFLASISLAIAVGIFLSHLFGTFLHWSMASTLCGLFPLTGGFVIYFAQESPVWLASRNRIDECITSFHWYRGKSLATEIELQKMLVNLQNKTKPQNKRKAVLENLRKPEFYKPLLLMVVFFVICQLSGINVIASYTTDILQELMGSSESSFTYAAMLSMDILRCLALGLACALLRIVGRRPMALFSGVFTSVSLISLAIYLYLFHAGVIKYISPFISLSLMAFYIAVSNMGIALLPWNMVGEVFSVEMKGIGSGVSVMMTSLGYFMTIKTAPSMFRSIGFYGAYLFYGLSTTLGTLFLYFYLPETKNKTLLQIEEYFRGNDIKEKHKSSSINIS